MTTRSKQRQLSLGESVVLLSIVVIGLSGLAFWIYVLW